MGYFSDLDLNEREMREERGCTSQKDALLCRYNDLCERYEELLSCDAPTFGDEYFGKSDYLYAPVECFNTLRDVRCACDVAAEELELRFGISVGKESAAIEDHEEVDPNQITFELVFLPVLQNFSVAA